MIGKDYRQRPYCSKPRPPVSTRRLILHRRAATTHQAEDGFCPCKLFDRPYNPNKRKHRGRRRRSFRVREGGRRKDGFRFFLPLSSFFSISTMIVCCVVPNANGVQRWEVSTLIQPPRSTPCSSGSYQAPCGMSITPGMIRTVRRQGRITRPFIKDFHMIAVFDSAPCGINGINENPLRKSFFQPIIIVVSGMDAVECVMSDSLK